MRDGSLAFHNSSQMNSRNSEVMERTPADASGDKGDSGIMTPSPLMNGIFDIVKMR